MLLFYGISLMSIQKIPVYLHSQGKKYHHYQMVFFKEEDTIHVIILKGE